MVHRVAPVDSQELAILGLDLFGWNELVERRLDRVGNGHRVEAALTVEPGSMCRLRRSDDRRASVTGYRPFFRSSYQPLEALFDGEAFVARFAPKELLLDSSQAGLHPVGLGRDALLGLWWAWTASGRALWSDGVVEPVETFPGASAAHPISALGQNLLEDLQC